jgi:DNA-binding IclR family transcriptional regulator
LTPIVRSPETSYRSHQTRKHLNLEKVSFISWSANSPGAQAINRAAAVLRILAVNGAHGVSLGEVARLTDLPKSTAHRVLAALVDEGFAERARQSQLYRLGIEIVALSAASGADHDLRALARPALERISANLGHTAYLAIRIGYDVICLDQTDIGGGAAAVVGKGMRVPLGISAHGIVMLAFLNDDEVRNAMTLNLPRLQGNAVFTMEQVISSIAKIRRQGYAIANLKFYPQIYGLAVPVLDSRRRPLAAIGITTLTGQPLKTEQVLPVVTFLKREAAAIAQDYERLHDTVAERWQLAGSPQWESNQNPKADSKQLVLEKGAHRRAK